MPNCYTMYVTILSILFFMFLGNACVFCKSETGNILYKSEVDFNKGNSSGKDILFLKSVIPTMVNYGSELVLKCEATLVDKSYQLFHIWLYQSDVAAKIAAFFPHRGREEMEYVSPNEQRLYDLRVTSDVRRTPVNTTYILTATFPSVTCAHQTSFYCWVFAYPSPEPLQTAPKHVKISPCDKTQASYKTRYVEEF